MGNLEFIRGTTPSIEITVKTEIDLHQVTQVWSSISQQKNVKILKTIDDAEFDYENRKMTFRYTQEETLGLKAGEAIIQIRALLEDGTALATHQTTVDIYDTNKDGVITEG